MTSTDGLPFEMVNGEEVNLTIDQIAAISAAQAVFSANNAVVNLKSQARSLLAESDLTVSRIAEAVVLGFTTWTDSDVVAWMNYRRGLRAIIVSGNGTVPEKPSYPAGT